MLKLVPLSVAYKQYIRTPIISCFNQKNRKARHFCNFAFISILDFYTYCLLSDHGSIVVASAEFKFKLKSDSIDQILRLMPVMLLKPERGDIFINLNEFILTPGVIEAFLLCSDDPNIASVENHGFSAHNRRRNETANTSGVSITQIKEHLVKAVPRLKEHGISKTTIRRSFQPPNRGNTVSRRYAALIDARRVMKSTSYREYHPDDHYLFARNKHRREFCSLYKEDCCIISMDGMAQIKVGAPAVSQYHHLRRLYPQSDMPNYFPVPNYLLSASGYMTLEDKNKEVIGAESAHLPDSTYDKTNDSAHKSNITVHFDHPDSLMCAISNQCRSQLNVTTIADELRETIINEILCCSDVYCEHFNVEKAVLDELCAKHLEYESSFK